MPLIVPAYYPENAWPGVAPTDEFWFGTDMYEDAWFIDSGTSDVTKMKLGKRGLAVRGGYNPPQVRLPWLYMCALACNNLMQTANHLTCTHILQANKLRNASYGQFPKVQWYSAEHKDFGVKMYIVRSGSSGGKKNAATWEDVGFWDAPGRISESVRQRIVDAEYFNRPAASMAAKARGGADFFKGPYDPKKYLVRITVATDATRSKYLQTSYPRTLISASALLLCHVRLLPQRALHLAAMHSTGCARAHQSQCQRQSSAHCREAVAHQF